MHPSGLTWARWHWPFKTQAEREQIRAWLDYQNVNNGSTPF